KAAIQNEEYEILPSIGDRIKELESRIENQSQEEEISNSEKEIFFRFQEYKALKEKEEDSINLEDDLKVKDVTKLLHHEVAPYFSRILRIDNMKMTSAQLD